MKKIKSLGVGLGAATLLGINTLELGNDVFESVANIEKKTEEAHACAAELPPDTIIEAELPEGCLPYAGTFKVASGTVHWEEASDPTLYQLPMRDNFLAAELTSIANTERNGERGVVAAATIAGLGGLALGYYVARGNDTSD